LDITFGAFLQLPLSSSIFLKFSNSKMSKIKKIISTLILLGVHCFSFAQTEPNEIVISGGTGFAPSNTTLKTVVNLALKESGLSSRVSHTWLINGMIDFSIKKNISVGIAYSHIQFNWQDQYLDTVQGISTQVNADVLVQKRNYAIRGLYHFGVKENFEIYAGGRIGLTHWIFDVNADGSIADKESASDFSIPATLPSIQLIGGFRHYFGRVFGWFGEIGVGTSPYLLSIGVNIRPNPSK
jgi:hypothetical protein